MISTPVVLARIHPVFPERVAEGEPLTPWAVERMGLGTATQKSVRSIGSGGEKHNVGMISTLS